MKNTPKPFSIINGLWICIFFLYSFAATAQTASIKVSPVNGTYCAPSPVRLTAEFSTPPIGFLWDFGILSDEDFRAPNPIINYDNAGTYTITLTALFPNTLVQSSYTLIVHGLPSINLLVDRDSICQPGTVKFTAESQQIISSYTWNFGDGTPSITESTGIITHAFNSFKDYSVQVATISTEGCSAQQSIPFSIKKLTADLAATRYDSCLPVNVLFKADISGPAGTTITNYTWNFGDGSPLISTANNQVNHTYTIASGVEPTLSIITSEGCTDTFAFDSLFFGNPPQAVHLSAEDSSICFSDLGKFKATAVGANAYRWDFGDNTTFITTDTVVTYKFGELKDYNVKVTPLFNGCENKGDSLIINIKGVKSDFGLNNRCDDRATFDYYPYSFLNITKYSWDFGDGSPTSNLAYPTHTYADTGSYLVTLLVSDSVSGCKDTYSRYAYLAYPKLAPADSFVCRKSPFTLKVVEASSGPNVSFLFTHLGHTTLDYGPNNNFITEIADSAGIFYQRVIVFNESTCPDTLIQAYPVRVAGPIPDFDSPAILCLTDSMTAQNLTTSAFPYDQVTNWSWNFGNGTHTDNKASPTPFKYGKSGKYWVNLQATDMNGCMDSVGKLTAVNKLPYIFVDPASSLICPGETVLLNALHQGSIQWSPVSNISCDTCSSTIVNPTISTIYTATATDTVGCSSTFDVNIGAHTPYIFNHSLRDTGFCIGGSAQLDVGIYGILYKWSPATGLSNPNIRNPIARPNSNTIYNVDVIDSAGCFPLSVQVNVLVHPLPTIDPGPPVIVPYNTPFTLSPTYGPDIVSYKWNPIIQLNCSTCPAPSGIALESYIYTVTATTSKGCAHSNTLQLFIECNANNILMPNVFSPNNDNLNDIFYPITRGMKQINKFIIYNRYGEVVFERSNFKPNDKNFGWNGTQKGNHSPSGSYIYYMEALCILGEVFHNKGSVMLIR